MLAISVTLTCIKLEISRMYNLLYPLLRPLLFQLDPETAHSLTLSALKWLSRGTRHHVHPSIAPQQIMGITFPNPVGLAAGLDKDGTYIDALATLGFGFIEVGTVTPRPQAGNPQPRLFRLPKAQALINRMGFNNHGIEACIANIQNSQFFARGGILGINIGKNADTPIEEAITDYIYCLEKAYPYASYITINISSPNTNNLRELQYKNAFNALLSTLKAHQQQLADKYQRYVPLAIKIAPDLEQEQLKHIAEGIITHNIDGLIATNTTLARHDLAPDKHVQETGGLSGAPLFESSNRIIQTLRTQLGKEFPIIGVGGILTADNALQKQLAGANLVQIYTGLIYQGPQLIDTCVQAFAYNKAG